MGMPALSQVAKASLDAVFPQQCAFCRNVLEPAPRFPGICRHCLSRIPFRMGSDARLDLLNALPVYSATWYRENMRTVIRRFKFADSPDLAAALAALIHQVVSRSGIYPIAVCAVPLHRQRLVDRGYNQAGLLAEKLAGELGLAYWSDCLVRTRPTLRQSELKGHGYRRANVQGAFKLSDEWTDRHPFDIRPAVLLVDDVLTTGATLCAAAAPLIAEGYTVTGVTASSDHRASSRFSTR